MKLHPGAMIDSHVHLVHEDFGADLRDILDRAHSGNVRGFVVPATDAASSHQCVLLAKEHEDIVAAVGIHPHDVSKAASEDLKRVEDLTNETSVVAIGEIGLDYYYDFSPKEQQREFFQAQLDLASDCDLPVIVHTRESMQDAIDMVRAHAQNHPHWCTDGDIKRRGVFHCFTGTEEQAKELSSLGFYISFPGILTFKRSPVLDVFMAVGMERVLLETDAPYMAPVPLRGKRNEPSYIVHIAQKMAELTGKSIDDIAHITSTNTLTLFLPE